MIREQYCSRNPKMWCAIGWNLLTLTVFACLSVAEIVIALRYAHESNCSSRTLTQIDFKLWLLVQGGVGIGAVVFSLLWLCTLLSQESVRSTAPSSYSSSSSSSPSSSPSPSSARPPASSYGTLLLCVIPLFQLVWICIGGILFWHDCDGSVHPAPLHIMMWCSLVIGCLFCLRRPSFTTFESHLQCNDTNNFV